MYKMRNARTTALASLAVAVLVAFAAGPATAGHGLTMKEHPLRGNFPIAIDKAPSTSVDDAASADVIAVARQRVEPGSWLRGDFPLAAESQADQASPEPVTARSKADVPRGVGETWSCTVQTASAQHAGSGPTQAMMRVIHLAQ